MLTEDLIKPLVNVLQSAARDLPPGIGAVIVLVDYRDGSLAVLSPEGTDDVEVLKAALRNVEIETPVTSHSIPPEAAN
jgi:hypothetical protein